jgi:hypothetical protein
MSTEEEEMPVKRMNGGVTVTVEEAFGIAEMYRLAEVWHRHPYEFESVQLERYRELCAKYGVDSSVLLYSVQNQGVLPNASGVDVTSPFPAVGDLPNADSID